ncbi:hypothetical protein DNL40_11795 [Xylanimonas oleitrophica]|uniref:Ceramidase n=1 Tax=Xylanimonas oleitrophica TaxID=2607479 RepID=A0A2W5WNM0_9MICO|nr:hypothetical protein [Xylanimonas oleitrophica]PZR52353.1 hypothetical protein DNL40_11795 [Xylanimonas oleitrophica]
MLPNAPTTTGCEPAGDWPWTEPASTVTSLAFVLAGAWVLLRAARADDDGRAPRVALGVLTVLIGAGSVVQHGPAPAWNPLVHDPPLLGALALVAADGVADLTGRPLRTWWWLAPTLADVGLAAVSVPASAAAQAVTAVVAVVVTLLRVRARPEVRRRSLMALTLLAVGAAVGRLSEPGMPWCAAGGWWGTPASGHALWHLLAAVALAVLAPAVGRRPRR